MGVSALAASAQSQNSPCGVIVPGNAKAASVQSGTSGFLVRPYFVPNTASLSTANEAQSLLADRYVDASDFPLSNLATKNGADSNGYFSTAVLDGSVALPGTPSDLSTRGAVEILTFLQLTKGCQTLVANSPGKFELRLGRGAFGQLLGSGRDETRISITVEADGVYPVRLLWWGGANVARLGFFSEPSPGLRIAINDRQNAAAIRAYSQGTTGGFLSDFGPVRTIYGVNPGASLYASFQNAATLVDPASVQVWLDDAIAPFQTLTSGASLLLSIASTKGSGFGTLHQAAVVYRVGGQPQTNTVTFRMRVDGLFIEAEDYDYDGGKSIEAVNSMPYIGHEYQGLGAAHNIDYHQNEDRSDAGTIGYRIGDVPNVPMDRQVDPGTLDVLRGSFAVSDNYNIRWADEGEWFNYTRRFTNGNYYIFAAQSHGDAAGTPNRLRLRVGLSSGGVFQQWGAYQAPATGEYGASALNQVMNGPVPAVVHLSGTQTIRVYQDEGDFDWLVFVPTSESVSGANFVIEAEDFNFAGGQTRAAASVMPLSAGLYSGLGAVVDVDYHVSPDGQPGAQAYRTGETPNVRISDNIAGGMNVRGPYGLTTNYLVWIDSGEWFNYTRSFPSNTYNVYAALSHAEDGPTSGSLSLVSAGSTATTQTVAPLGSFYASGGTGGFGANRFVPLVDSAGRVATVPLSGVKTVRYSGTSGDFDYLVFVPVSESTQPPTSVQISPQSNGALLVQWTGGGTLLSSPIVGPGAQWEVVGTGGSVTVQKNSKTRFFRVVSP